VAEVSGVNSQGETLEEAKPLVLEALHELLDYRSEKVRRNANLMCPEDWIGGVLVGFSDAQTLLGTVR